MSIRPVWCARPCVDVSALQVVETLEGRKFVDLQYQHPAEF